MEENSLIDNDFNGGKNKRDFYTVASKIFMLVGLFYGAYLFFMYFKIKQGINPLLPTYTSLYIFGDPALKGGVLLTSLSICQVLILFRKYAIVFYILLLTFALIFSGIYLLLIPLN